jgi:hypothetical protein
MSIKNEIAKIKAKLEAEAKLVEDSNLDKANISIQRKRSKFDDLSQLINSFRHELTSMGCKISVGAVLPEGIQASGVWNLLSVGHENLLTEFSVHILHDSGKSLRSGFFSKAETDTVFLTTVACVINRISSGPGDYSWDDKLAGHDGTSSFSGFSRLFLIDRDKKGLCLKNSHSNFEHYLRRSSLFSNTDQKIVSSISTSEISEVRSFIATSAMYGEILRECHCY